MKIRPDGVGAGDNAQILLTRKQLAKRLNIQPHTLACWSMRGFGPKVIKLGRSCRYSPREVDAWISEQARG